VAGHPQLKARPSIRIAGLAAVVIALHVWFLQWLGDALSGPPLLTPMAVPMFTRLLQPEAPKVAQAEPAAPARNRKRKTIAAVREAAAPKPAKPASQSKPPEQAAQAPEPPPSTPVLPEPAASAPVDVASAAQPAASAASAPAPANLDSWPVDTRLSYRLTGWYDGALTGTARVQWLRQGDRYEARVDLDLGIFGMQFLSQGDVTEKSLLPRAYQESRPGRTRIVQIAGDSVVLNDGRTVLKPPGAQDTASHFVELSHRFATGQEKLVVGARTNVWLARPGGVDLWTYDIVSLDRLDTPKFGMVEAYHLKPRAIRDARGDISAEIWIAPTLQYLPVRIRITQGQRWVDILVDRIEQR
jgi:hypothetical protein